MKTKLLFLSFFALALAVSAQQELRLINNTGQNINVYLRVNGTGCVPPLCSDYFESELFTIGTGTTTFNSFQDFDVLSPPVGFTKGSGGVCNPPSGPCSGAGVFSNCGNPLWVMIGFSYPGAGCCLWRVGETSCGYVDLYIHPNTTYTIRWNPISPTLIIVTFNI